MPDLNAAAHNAARAGWFLKEATIGDAKTLAAINPTDQDEIWVFLPEPEVWWNTETKEEQTTIPLCKHVG